MRAKMEYCLFATQKRKVGNMEVEIVTSPLFGTCMCSNVDTNLSCTKNILLSITYFKYFIYQK